MRENAKVVKYEVKELGATELREGFGREQSGKHARGQSKVPVREAFTAHAHHKNEVFSAYCG